MSLGAAGWDLSAINHKPAEVSGATRQEATSQALQRLAPERRLSDPRPPFCAESVEEITDEVDLYDRSLADLYAAQGRTGTVSTGDSQSHQAEGMFRDIGRLVLDPSVALIASYGR